MGKLRMIQVADGRIGFPDVVDYEVVEGEHAGLRLPVPPSPEEFPQPGNIGPPRGCAYRQHVHDRDTFDWLTRTNRILVSHGKHNVVDNRMTS